MYCCSFISNRARSGELVRSRRAVQSSRVGALRMVIWGGGKPRFQNCKRYAVRSDRPCRVCSDSDRNLEAKRISRDPQVEVALRSCLPSWHSEPHWLRESGRESLPHRGGIWSLWTAIDFQGLPCTAQVLPRNLAGMYLTTIVFIRL